MATKKTVETRKITRRPPAKPQDVDASKPIVSDAKVSMQPPRPQLPADSGVAKLLGYGVGADSRLRPVWITQGVVWCSCSNWLDSTRKPRTCSHVSAVAAQGAAPDELRMARPEILRERAHDAPDHDFTDILPAIIEGVGFNAQRQSSATAITVTPPRARRALANYPSDLMRKAFSAMREMRIACVMQPGEIVSVVDWAKDRAARFDAAACYTREAWSTRDNGLEILFATVGERPPAEVGEAVVDAFRKAGFRAEVSTQGDRVLVFGWVQPRQR